MHYQNQKLLFKLSITIHQYKILYTLHLELAINIPFTLIIIKVIKIYHILIH